MREYFISKPVAGVHFTSSYSFSSYTSYISLICPFVDGTLIPMALFHLDGTVTFVPGALIFTAAAKTAQPTPVPAVSLLSSPRSPLRLFAMVFGNF